MLCGDFNNNEPLPVSHGTVLDGAPAGGASLQVHRCAGLCVSVCVCVHDACSLLGAADLLADGEASLSVCQDVLFIYFFVK